MKSIRATVLIFTIILMTVIAACNKNSSEDSTANAAPISPAEAQEIAIDWIMALKSNSIDEMQKLSSSSFARVEEETYDERGKSCGPLGKAKGNENTLKQQLKCFTDNDSLQRSLKIEDLASVLKSCSHKLSYSELKTRQHRKAAMNLIGKNDTIIEFESSMGDGPLSGGMGDYYSLLFTFENAEGKPLVKTVALYVELDPM